MSIFLSRGNFYFCFIWKILLNAVSAFPIPQENVRDIPRDISYPRDKIEENEKKIEKVYTVTDRPVDLNRLPNPTYSPNTSQGIGGTFVTIEDITDPVKLLEHMRENVPPRFRKNYYPPILSEILIPCEYLMPDPHARPESPTRWIPPGSPGTVSRTWDVTENPRTLLPIITPRGF